MDAPIETDAALCLKAQAGDAAALDALMARHEPLVRRLVANLHWQSIVGTDDLLQVGRLGLMKAVRAWDPTRNVKLVTVAFYCIRNALFVELRNQKRATHYAVTSHSFKDYIAPPILDGAGVDLSVLSHVARRAIEEVYGLNGTIRPKAEIADMLGLTGPQLNKVVEESLRVLRLVARPEDADAA